MTKPVSMPVRAYTLLGSHNGRLAGLTELVALAKRGVIKPVISDRFLLDQAAEALAKLKAGQIIGSWVLKP